MADLKKRTPVSSIFSHLSEEERIDKACELLAIGVLRLATNSVIASSAGAKQSQIHCDGDRVDLHKNKSMKQKNEAVHAD